MRRNDICLYLGPADRIELQALITNRNTPRKLVWRSAIILATADGHGTFEIMRRARTSKPTVWRWQQRYLDEGVAKGLVVSTVPFNAAVKASRESPFQTAFVVPDAAYFFMHGITKLRRIMQTHAFDICFYDFQNLGVGFVSGITYHLDYFAVELSSTGWQSKTH